MDVPRDFSRWPTGRDASAAAFLLLALLVLGFGLLHWNGHYSPLALVCVGTALALASAALAGSGRSGRTFLHLPVVAVAVVATSLIADAFFRPSFYVERLGPPGLQGSLFSAGAVLALVAILGRGAVARVATAGAFAVFAWAGIVAFAQHPFPPIDVVVFHRDAAVELAAGGNPYAMDFPQIYPEVVASVAYGEGLVEGDRLKVGYPYPPLTLLWMVGFEWLWDARLGSVVAMLAAGGFLIALAPGPLTRAAAFAFLFSLRNFFVIEQGWTEPLCAMLLAGFAWSCVRRPALAPWFFGLFLASKQFCVLLLPLALLTLPETRRPGFLIRAFAIGAAVTLPFFLWDPAAFWKALVSFQFQQPFRMNALSVAAFIALTWGVKISPAISFGLGAAATWVVSRIGRPGLFRFLAGSAIVLLVFFGTNKQAFCNYYFLVIAFLAAATALLGVTENRTDGDCAWTSAEISRN